MKRGRTILTVLICICILPACVLSVFAEGDNGADNTAETTTAQSLFGSIKDVFDANGLGGTVDTILGGLENGDVQGALSDAVGGISDGLSDALGDYSSALSGIFGGSQSGGSQQNDVVNNGSNVQSNFAVPKTYSGSTYQQSANQSANQPEQKPSYTPAATAPATVTQTNPVPETNGQIRQKNDAASVVIDTSAQNTVWFFIIGIAAVILITVLILIVVTKHTEFNSRVYDRTALKSVRKSSSSDMLIDDGDSPMDNILYVGSSEGNEK